MSDLETNLTAPHDLDRGEFGPVFARPSMVALVAVLAGFAIDTLALHQPPGVGLALGLLLGVTIAGSISTLLGLDRPCGTRPLVAAGVATAAFIAVRTSPVMISLNVFATAVIISLLVQLNRSTSLRESTVTAYWRLPFATIGNMAIGSGRFVSVDIRGGFGAEQSAVVRSVAVGLLIGAPLLVVFGGLFVSADAVFSDYLDAAFSGFFFGSIAWRVGFTFLVALLIAGLWRTLRSPQLIIPPTEARRRLDRTTGVTVLALLVALFLFFVVTQVLGGDAEPLRHRDYSDSARQGFFQLVTVAFLVLNVLLYFDWLTLGRDRLRSPAFDRLAVTLIGLTGLVMVSALGRMRQYVDEFGLTELRFYTTVFMFWLAFVLIWFMVTILRNRHAAFALGLIVSAGVFILGLNVANPDSFIVNANWQRHVDGASFSDRYNSELSVDSVPTLIAIREEGLVGQWCFLERRLALAAIELDAYYEEHGPLADSVAAWRARRALGTIALFDPDELACVDPRPLRIDSLSRDGGDQLSR